MGAHGVILQACPTKKEESKGYKCTAENSHGVATEMFKATIIGKKNRNPSPIPPACFNQ